MTNKQNIKALITNVNAHNSELLAIETTGFKATIPVMVSIGRDFSAIIKAENESLAEGATPIAPYTVATKYAKQFVFSVQVLVNRALPLFIADEAGTLKGYITKWETKGDGTKECKNADGTVKARLDLFAIAVHAGNQGRWAASGKITKTSGNAKDKAKAIKSAEAALTKLGFSDDGAWAEWDLRHLEMTDLETLAKAIVAAKRLLAAKAL